MTKNVTHCSEQIFGGDLPKRIQGIKNNKKLFKKEKKILFKPKTLQKISPKPRKSLPERVPTRPKQQLPSNYSIQIKRKTPKET